MKPIHNAEQKADTRTMTETAAEQLDTKIRELAAASPDFVYTPHVGGVHLKCSYAPDRINTQGCIVGAALAALGVAYQLRWEGQPARVVLRGIGIPSMFADLVQGNQDRGETWSDAVRSADRHLEEVTS